MEQKAIGVIVVVSVVYVYSSAFSLVPPEV